jgi:hypothetical protein
LQLVQTPSAHPFGDQAALVFRHRATDLQQQPIVRIPGHRPVEELDLATGRGQFLEQQHLMDILSRQPVRRGDQHPVEGTERRAVTQPLQAGPLEAGTAVAIIAEDVLGRHRPALRLGVRLQTLQLLGNAVGLCLTLCRYTCIERDPHG